MAGQPGHLRASPFGRAPLLGHGIEFLTPKNRPSYYLIPFDRVRKILGSVKFLFAILGPEMAAPVLWAPGKNASVLLGKNHVHRIPRFRGGVFWVWGGGSADFIFMGARIFLTEA